MTAQGMAMLHVEHEEEASRVPLDLIDPNPYQPRQYGINEEDLRELTQSIAEVGVLTPILVRPLNGRYQLVAGERRTTASRFAGQTSIPALIRPYTDDEMLRLAIVENVQRSDLNLMEEAHAYQNLMEQTGATQAEVAAMVGKSRAHVGHVLGVLNMLPSVQRRAAAGVLSLGHLKVMMSLKDPYVVEALADRIVAEGLTVRNVEELVILGDLPGAEGAIRISRQRSKTRGPVDVAHARNGISRWLDTRVQVLAGRSRGKIVIEFADLEDLARILTTMQVPACEVEE